MKVFISLVLTLCVASFAFASNVDKAAVEEALAALEAGMELTKAQDAVLNEFYSNGGGGNAIDNAGGPDNYGYTWEDSEEEGGPVYEWIDISENGTSVIGDMSDDNIGGPYPIGFSFPLYDNEYSNFYVGSNGAINFDGQYISLSNQQMPSTSYQAMIAWFWDDVDPANASDADLLYDTMVIDDRNALVISFLNWDEYPGYTDPDGQEDVTAQIILFENGKIKINYMSVESPGLDITSCTIGIQNAGGNDGLTALYNGSIGGYPYDELAIKFSDYELSELEVSPLVLDFGSIPVGETAVLPLLMSATEDSPVIIDSYLFEFPTGFSIDMVLPFTIQPEEEVEVDVTFAPPGVDDWSSDLWIHSDALNEIVTVYIIAEATAGNTSELVVSPLELDFGSIFEGETSVLPLQMSVNGVTPVIIDGYTFQFPTGFSMDLIVPHTLQPGDILDVDVTFAPPSAADWSSSLWINSNAANPTVTVNLIAEATTVNTSELVVSPLELDFGTIMEGETAVLQLQISVDGDIPVTIEEYTFEFPTGFQWDLTVPYTLQPTDVIYVNVTFAPPSAADWSSSLWINSNAANPTVTVNLIADATVNSVSEGDDDLLPTSLEVTGAYPNPFNASTVIKIRAPHGRTINAVIYDVRGREVHRYEPYRQGGSTTQLAFEGDTLPSGLYFCHITDGVTNVSQKLVLLK